jgi:hypothetical protein
MHTVLHTYIVLTSWTPLNTRVLSFSTNFSIYSKYPCTVVDQYRRRSVKKKIKIYRIFIYCEHKIAFF